MSVSLLLNSMKVTVNWLTNKCVEALWLVVPVDSQEVDGDTGQHDGQPDAAHHGLRVQGEDEQEGPEDQVNHGPDKANLKHETWNIATTCQLQCKQTFQKLENKGKYPS